MTTSKKNTNTNTKTKGLASRIWRVTKRVLLILFILQFVYIFLLKWINLLLPWWSYVWRYFAR